MLLILFALPQGGSGGSSSGKGGNEIDLSMDELTSEGGESGDGADGTGDKEALAAMAAQLADELLEKFEKQMLPVIDSLDAANGHLGDLEELLDSGQSGWDLSSGLWQNSGWREFKNLRKKLQDLRELRDLVWII